MHEKLDRNLLGSSLFTNLPADRWYSVILSHLGCTSLSLRAKCLELGRGMRGVSAVAVLLLRNVGSTGLPLRRRDRRLPCMGLCHVLGSQSGCRGQ